MQSGRKPLFCCKKIFSIFPFTGARKRAERKFKISTAPDLDNANGGKMVKINGVEKHVSQKTLTAYLQENHFNINRIAVECNGQIVPKSKYDETLLQDGDTFEIVTFVGGG